MAQETTVSIGKNILEQPDIVRAIAESTLDAIILMDDKGGIYFWNPAAERIFGYKSSEVIGKNLHRLLAPDRYHSAHEYAFEEFSRSGKGNAVGKIVELFALKNSGEEFPIELSLSSFQIDGRWYAAGIVRDVTERKRLEQALQDSQNRFELFMNNNPAIAWVKDDQGRHVYLNKTYEKRFGVTLEKWFGKTDFEVWPHDIAQTFWKNDQAVLASGKPIETVEETTESNGSRAFWFNFKFPFQDSTGTRFVGGMGLDITKRKELEAEKEKDSQEMSWLMKSMISGFTVCQSVFDHQGVFVDYRMLYVNDAYERLTGVGAKDVLGKTVFEVWPETEQTWIEKCGRVAVTGNPDTFELYHNPTKKYWRCSLYRPWESTDRFCMIFDDITEITEAKRQKAALERKALQAEKLQSLSIMAGGIAHDFNNQLAVAIGFLELAMDSETLDSETKSYLMKAMTASERSAKLSEQMLIYSGSNTYIPVPLNLREFLEINQDQLESSVSGHVTLDIDIAKKLPFILGNPDHIIRLVRNILINASEAIGSTGGHIKLSTGVTVCDEAELSQSYIDEKPSPGRLVFLEVSDTGRGMDAGTLHKLVDPFFTTKFAGRGLGMAEVIGIVKGHRGALFVESKVGKGTTVRVLFPVLKDSTSNTPHWTNSA